MSGGNNSSGVFSPANLNLFSYTWNNPINFVDLDGKENAKSRRMSIQSERERQHLYKKNGRTVILVADVASFAMGAGEVVAAVKSGKIIWRLARPAHFFGDFAKVSLNTLKRAVTKDGRLHIGKKELELLAKDMGYTPENLNQAIAIVKNSVKVRRSDRPWKYMNSGHRARIKIEEGVLKILEDRLK